MAEPREQQEQQRAERNASLGNDFLEWIEVPSAPIDLISITEQIETREQVEVAEVSEEEISAFIMRM